MPLEGHQLQGLVGQRRGQEAQSGESLLSQEVMPQEKGRVVVGILGRMKAYPEAEMVGKIRQRLHERR